MFCLFCLFTEVPGVISRKNTTVSGHVLSLYGASKTKTNMPPSYNYIPQMLLHNTTRPVLASYHNKRVARSCMSVCVFSRKACSCSKCQLLPVPTTAAQWFLQLVISTFHLITKVRGCKIPGKKKSHKNTFLCDGLLLTSRKALLITFAREIMSKIVTQYSSSEVDE